MIGFFVGALFSPSKLRFERRDRAHQILLTLKLRLYARNLTPTQVDEDVKPITNNQ